MQTESAMQPVVILVNGPSSAGKSTFCRALQDHLTDLAAGNPAATFASVAFDDKFRLISDKLYAIDFVKRSGGDLGRLASRNPNDGRAAWEYADEGDADGKHGGSPRIRLVLSPHTRRLLTGIHRGWGEHLKLGTNLLIDHFLQEKDWCDEVLAVIRDSGARCFSVGVFCSLEELERRESSRGDGRLEGRPLGLARRSDEVCHTHGLDYDVTVRTDQHTVAESVEKVVAGLRAAGCLPGDRTSASAGRSPISRRASAFDSSGIRKAFDLAARLPDPINLAIGQPDFPMPAAACAAAKAAIDAGRSGYTQTQGIPQLRERLEQAVRADLGDPRRKICVTSGSSGALVLVLMALVDPGDEVIIFEPAFVMYRPLVEFLGGTCVAIDTSPSFRIDVDRVAAAITPRTKAILLNTPSNPTGSVAPLETVRALALLAERAGVTLISDELYRSYCYDEPFHSPASHSDRVVVIDGFSKSHAMTGWRVGWVHGPPEVIDACTMLQQYTFVCAPQVGQWGAIAALDAPMDAPLAECKRKRDRLMAGLAGHYRFERPGGAFYLYPEAPGGSGKRFAQLAAEREQLIVVPGSVFGAADTHFRIAYTVSDQTLDRGIAALLRLAAGA
jgi:aspartate aminotransferase/aminotransferase